MQIESIASAIGVVTNRRAIQDRALVLEAATFLATHADELTSRVAVNITPDELSDPAWADVVANSWNPCVCGEAECRSQFSRIFGPKLRNELVAGETVVVTPGKRLWLRLKGTEGVLQSFAINGDQGTLEINTAGLEPGHYPLAPIGEHIATLGAAERTLRAKGTDGFLVVAARLESVDPEAKSLTITLDADVEQFAVRDTLAAGETVTIEAGKKVYLRKKGAGDTDALVAFSVDNGALVLQNEPFDPMAQLEQMMSGGPTSFGLVDIKDQVLPLPEDQRVFSTGDAFGLPVPLVRFDTVDVDGGSVTVTLDQDIEAYEPTAEPASAPQMHVLNLGDLGALGALLGGAPGYGGDEGLEERLFDEGNPDGTVEGGPGGNSAH